MDKAISFGRTAPADLSSLVQYTLDSFFPAYAHVSKRFPRFFQALGVLFALYYVIPIDFMLRTWYRISNLVVSSVKIESGDDLFEPLADFLTQKSSVRANNQMIATTNSAVVPKPGEIGYDSDQGKKDDLKKRQRVPPTVTYQQARGLQLFFHKKRIFWVVRDAGIGHTFGRGSSRPLEELVVHTLGRSTKSIQTLLHDIFHAKWEAENTKTIVRRAMSNRWGSGMSWTRVSAKSHRSLDTVYLPDDQSKLIVSDVEDYLSMETKAFYTHRGIPYRRGYLLYGPPGCGKTSFCLALAAKFNIDVYILTLLDHNLDDTSLSDLFNNLPTPSILLLEDIDQAGLGRKLKKSRRSPGGKAQGMEMDKIDLDEAFESSDGDSDMHRRSERRNVTLSGLLNAIDGVAAPEGHILIMTTNKPEDLDFALVRAGRVSVRAEFSLATKSQARQMFASMFPEDYILRKQAGRLALASSVKRTVLELGEKFVDEIDDNDLSPAELQDYLLSHKEDPYKAVEGIRAFVAEQRRKRVEKEEELKQAELDKKRRAKMRRMAFAAKRSGAGASSDDSLNDANEEDDAPDDSNDNDDKNEYDDKGNEASSDGTVSTKKTKAAMKKGDKRSKKTKSSKIMKKSVTGDATEGEATVINGDQGSVGVHEVDDTAEVNAIETTT